jgi:hypothetical protein
MRAGVHAFVVPLRDEAGGPLPGVEIRDCGYKVGFCGVTAAGQNQSWGCLSAGGGWCVQPGRVRLSAAGTAYTR